jgi:hypothetical protein
MHTLHGQKRMEASSVFSHTVKAVGDVEVKFHECLISSVDGGEWSASQF